MSLGLWKRFWGTFWHLWKMFVFPRCLEFFWGAPPQLFQNCVPFLSTLSGNLHPEKAKIGQNHVLLKWKPWFLQILTFMEYENGIRTLKIVFGKLLTFFRKRSVWTFKKPFLVTQGGHFHSAKSKIRYFWSEKTCFFRFWSSWGPQIALKVVLEFAEWKWLPSVTRKDF